jgi:hypothetical protein
VAKRTETKAQKPAPASGAPFEGFGWPFVLAAVVALGIPFLLHALDAVGEQVSGTIFGIAFLTICVVVAVWPTVDAVSGRVGLLAAVVAVGLGAGGAAGFALVRAIYPGDPAAAVEAQKTDEERPLPGLTEGARYDLMVHADLGAAAGQQVSAAYGFKLFSGTAVQTLSGRFESRQGRGRVGRRTVAVVKPPREWTHHEVVVGPGPHKMTLQRKDTAIGAMEFRFYPLPPLWPNVVIACALVLLAFALAARLRDRMRRQYFIGGVTATVLAGAIGAWWAWMGEPLFPVLGAAFVSMIAGWLLGKLLSALAGQVPWAMK